MKTIFHANIDGYEVALGIGEAFGLIDPVATAVKIAALLPALDECKQLLALNAQINAGRQEAGAEFFQAEQARQRGDAITQGRHNANYHVKLLALADLEKQLPALISAFEAARARITTENAVYAHPPQGEDLIDDAQAQALAAKLSSRSPGKALLMTGEYVTDLRGRDFYLPGPPWRHMVIDKLGEELPAEALAPEALTDDQKAEIAIQEEADRIAKLSPEDRQAEADRVKAAALTAAAQTRSELEIAGDKDALGKSQAQYADALSAVNAKYGTDLA